MVEWKRRQSEDLNVKSQDHGRQSNEETGLEAARKAAAARVEDTAKKALQEKEDAFAKCRAAEIAEKAAKECREKEQKRAEVYAINAVLRYGWHPRTYRLFDPTVYKCRTFHSHYGDFFCF